MASVGRKACSVDRHFVCRSCVQDANTVGAVQFTDLVLGEGINEMYVNVKKWVDSFCERSILLHDNGTCGR